MAGNSSSTSGVEAFGAVVVELSQRRGLDRSTLAEQAGVSADVINLWERGAGPMPSPAEARAVSEVLGMPASQTAVVLGYVDPQDLDAGAWAGQPSDAPGEERTYSEIETALRAIHDNPSRSEPLRTWAGKLLEQLDKLREFDRAEQLAAALGLASVPTLTPDQQRDLDAAIAKAEAEAERIYRSRGPVTDVLGSPVRNVA